MTISLGLLGLKLWISLVVSLCDSHSVIAGLWDCVCHPVLAISKPSPFLLLLLLLPLPPLPLLPWAFDDVLH